MWRMPGEDSCSKEDFPTFVVVVMMGEMRLSRWRRRGLADLRAVSPSEDWRSEDEARFGEGGSWSPWLSLEAKPISH